MADRPYSGFISPELHWLQGSLGLSHIFGENMVQNLSNMPLNQGIRSFLLSGQGNGPSQQFPNSLPSPRDAPQKKQPRRSPPNPLAYSLLIKVLRLSTVPIAAPCERVYLLMQCQNEMLKSGRLSGPYVGMKDCFLRTIKNEGFISLWRGSSVHFTKFLAREALLLSYNMCLPRIMGQHYPSASKKADKNVKCYLNVKFDSKRYMQWFAYIIPLSLLVYPLNYGRMRLATDVKSTGTILFSLDSVRKPVGHPAGDRQFTGLFDVWLKTLKSDGILGIYRGYTLYFLGNTTYFVIANDIKAHQRRRTLKGKQRKHSLLARVPPSFFIFGLQVACYPINSVGGRMMLTSGEAEKYKGVTDAFRQIVKHEGFFSLYKGVTPYIICIGAKNAAFALVVSTIHALVTRK